MELLTAAFSWPCLPATALLLIACLYWLGVVLGLQDADSLDGQLEWDGLLAWLGWRGVPLAIGISVVALLWWTGTMLAWHVWMPDAGFVLWASLGLFPVVLLVSRPLVRPFAVVFGLLSVHEKTRSFVGGDAVLLTPLPAGQIGQAEISTDGASLLVSVANETDQNLSKGSRVVVVERRADGVHVVVPSSYPEIV